MPKAARRMAAQRSFKRQQATVQRLYTQGAKPRVTAPTGLGAAANRFFRGGSFMTFRTPWRDRLSDSAALYGDGTIGRRCNTTVCSAPRKISGCSNARCQRIFLKTRAPIKQAAETKHERELQL